MRAPAGRGGAGDQRKSSEGIPLSVCYRAVPALGISMTFIEEPWSTQPEFTEGLAAIG